MEEARRKSVALGGRGEKKKTFSPFVSLKCTKVETSEKWLSNTCIGV